jgi:hypothetical protein
MRMFERCLLKPRAERPLCGATTTTGKPCRNRALQNEAHCGRHATPEEKQRHVEYQRQVGLALLSKGYPWPIDDLL